jgi:hypothetical protein
MFRIRQINDDLLTVNKQAITQVQEILKSHFSALPPEDIASLPAHLRNPFKQQFRSLLLVAERQPGKVAGFGLLMHDPELKFCFLDFLIAALGLDTAKGDPTGTWSLGGADFEWNGRRIGSLRLPTLVVQEGGYRTRVLGVNARRFFQGLYSETFP